MPFCAVTGYDNVAGLNTLDPQPRSAGITYGDVRYAANGSVDRHGYALTAWHYDYMTPAWFAAVKTLLGLSDTQKSAEVTIQTLKNDFSTFANYNANAVLPEIGDGYDYQGGKYLNVVWRFIKIEVVT